MNEILIQRLKEGRNKSKLKQSDVAAKLGLKGNTLSNYENGVSEPDIDTFCALCDIYNLDTAEILGEAYGLNVQGSDFEIKPSEIKHIKKYRTLDDSGKSHVDTVLSWEADRMKQIGLADTAPLEDKTVEQLEAEYKKSLSNSARNTGSDALSIIGERKEA